MRFLFVHQNFPGQYLHIARRLAADPGHDVTFLSHPNANQISTIRKVEYKPIAGSTPNIFKEAAEFETATIRARSIANTATTLADVGYAPDIIFGHNGWGEILHLKDVWPQTPLIPYFEFYYHDRGLDVDFDPEFPIPDRARSTIRLRNAVNLLGLQVADLGQTPTKFQHETYPAWAREKIRIMPEGVDLELCQPDSAASFSLAAARRTWRKQAKRNASSHRKLVTFVARNLEPYRGFHVLMRALPRLLRDWPEVDAVVVGGDEVSYGAPPAKGGTWRKRLLDEVGDELPPGRVLFPGQLSYADYLKLLKTSAVHVYLSYPFVASWSLREALACGCALVASDTPPVREFIKHRRNGLLVPFHDPVQLARGISALLADDELRNRLSSPNASQNLLLKCRFPHRCFAKKKANDFSCPFLSCKTPKFRTTCPPATCPTSSGNAMAVSRPSPSADQLARYFHLDRGDREVVDGLRGDHNRLGFALMLGSARFLGAFPGADLDIPRPITAFLIDQLGLKQEAGFKGYFDHGGQRIRHLALIRERYGFTEFADNGAARFRLTRWLYALCWSGDDHPGPLIERATSWLVVNKVLLPGVSILERFVGRIRDRAQKRLWKRLVAALDEKQRARIAALFDETNEASFAALDALRTVPKQRSSGEFLLHLERLDAIRAFDLRPSPPKGIPAASLERLARVARAGKPSAITALQEPRRTATVAALFHTLETAAQDDAAELAEALLTDLVKDAEADEKKARLRSLRDLDAAAILLRDMAALVFKEDTLPLNQWRDALFERLPRADLVAAMAEVDAIARPHDAKPYAELRTRWRRARRLFFNVATRLQMGAGPGGTSVQAAMRYLAGIADWSSATMRDAPTAAIPKAWQPLVLDADGRVADPKAYVFAVIDAWRAAVKRRDIFASPGTRYGDPRRGLLDGSTWQESKLVVCRALNRSLDADTEIAGLAQWLDGAWRTVADRAASNPDLRFETVQGKTRLVLTPLDRLEETETLRVLRPAIQGRMPKAAMPDLFLEVMRRTGFAQAFTHLSERQAKVEQFETSLCATLVAEACNIGIEAVSRQDVPAMRRERLAWVSQNFIRPDTIAAASARIVAAHATLPLVELWGAGDVASADGMRFTAPTSAIHAGPNPKYFGQSRGVTWYNLMSNQFSGLNGIVVPGTLRDSLVLLALLLEQETELEPIQVMTDTAACSDAVFGLFWLLGYQFSPRLADLGDAKLWRIDRKADYGPFNSLGKGTINPGLIRENWSDAIRLAGSLKLGHLKAAGIMRTLQVRDKPPPWRARSPKSAGSPRPSTSCVPSTTRRSGDAS